MLLASKRPNNPSAAADLAPQARASCLDSTSSSHHASQAREAPFNQQQGGIFPDGQRTRVRSAGRLAAAPVADLTSSATPVTRW
jgi:hypothetical protein